MPFLAGAIPLAVAGGGLLGGLLFGGKKNKPPAATPIDPQLQQILDLQKQFAAYGFPAAQKTLVKPKVDMIIQWIFIRKS